ncbi:MAG: Gfo/Idh/MocA family oxidoreductase [Opitutaceae bacterium]|nr:Gfo/Idh/MocA family oxidoreductase [Opitutaceae bacterium]
MPSRRDFLKTSALVAGSSLFAVPNILRGQPRPDSPFRNIVSGRRVRVCAVGLGGKGYSDLHGVAEEEIVGLCDVDFARGAEAFREFPNVPRYRDFRRMFDELGDKFDAVTIATPDHMHFPIAMMAIERGKHVYLQKPLTHTIGEARALKAAAAKAGVVTQMGNQGHANEGTRLMREWIEAGVIGKVTEVTVWTNRPVWPQNIAWPDNTNALPPATLDWNLWLGVAPYRAFRPNLVPFNWRGMWDYGTGAMGDMGCHLLDAPFWALNLRGNMKVTALKVDGGSAITGPAGAVVRFEFPARGPLPPLTLTWYEGTQKPERIPELDADQEMPRGGVLVRGDQGVIFSPTDYCESPRLLPAGKMNDFKRPPKVYPRVPKGNPHLEWIAGIKGGPVPGSNWPDHASDLTELNLLSNLALRLKKPIEWDYAAGRAAGLPEADRLIRKSYRLF